MTYKLSTDFRSENALLFGISIIKLEERSLRNKNMKKLKLKSSSPSSSSSSIPFPHVGKTGGGGRTGLNFPLHFTIASRPFFCNSYHFARFLLQNIMQRCKVISQLLPPLLTRSVSALFTSLLPSPLFAPSLPPFLLGLQINSLHPSLSRVTVETSTQDLNANSCNSFCIVRLLGCCLLSI